MYPSSSYASPLIAIVVIALCVLGIWRINPNSQDRPKTHTVHASETHNDFSCSTDSVEITSRSRDQGVNRVYEGNTNNLSNDAIKLDDGILNSDASKDPHDDLSFTREAQLSEEDIPNKKQAASETNGADAHNDRQHAGTEVSEFEKVQQSSTTEASEGNQKDVVENAGVQDENLDVKEKQNQRISECKYRGTSRTKC